MSISRSFFKGSFILGEAYCLYQVVKSQAERFRQPSKGSSSQSQSISVMTPSTQRDGILLPSIMGNYFEVLELASLKPSSIAQNLKSLNAPEASRLLFLQEIRLLESGSVNNLDALQTMKKSVHLFQKDIIMRILGLEKNGYNLKTILATLYSLSATIPRSRAFCLELIVHCCLVQNLDTGVSHLFSCMQEENIIVDTSMMDVIIRTISLQKDYDHDRLLNLFESAQIKCPLTALLKGFLMNGMVGYSLELFKYVVRMDKNSEFIKRERKDGSESLKLFYEAYADEFARRGDLLKVIKITKLVHNQGLKEQSGLFEAQIAACGNSILSYNPSISLRHMEAKGYQVDDGTISVVMRAFLNGKKYRVVKSVFLNWKENGGKVTSKMFEVLFELIAEEARQVQKRYGPETTEVKVIPTSIDPAYKAPTNTRYIYKCTLYQRDSMEEELRKYGLKMTSRMLQSYLEMSIIFHRENEILEACDMLHDSNYDNGVLKLLLDWAIETKLFDPYLIWINGRDLRVEEANKVLDYLLKEGRRKDEILALEDWISSRCYLIQR